MSHSRNSAAFIIVTKGSRPDPSRNRLRQCCGSQPPRAGRSPWRLGVLFRAQTCRFDEAHMKLGNPLTGGQHCIRHSGTAETRIILDRLNWRDRSSLPVPGRSSRSHRSADCITVTYGWRPDPNLPCCNEGRRPLDVHGPISCRALRRPAQIGEPPICLARALIDCRSLPRRWSRTRRRGGNLCQMGFSGTTGGDSGAADRSCRCIIRTILLVRVML